MEEGNRDSKGCSYNSKENGNKLLQETRLHIEHKKDTAKTQE